LSALCLQLPNVTDGERQKWPRDIAESNRELDALYAEGLSRAFLESLPGRARRPENATP
jgi:hypothetical protein